MSEIKVFALGGLSEDGKNMYCVEINDEIIVFDVGLKYATDETVGIDFIVPSFQYLKDNKERVKALFLSHGHVDNIGAVGDFAKVFSDVPIYMSKTTKIVVDSIFEENGISDAKVVVLKDFETTNFGDYSVFALPLTHSIPNNFGYAINTKQGIIFYSGDYYFDQSVGANYATDIGKLAYLGKQGVLCFLGESSDVALHGHTSPHHRVENVLTDFFESANRRAFVSVYSSNLYRIQEILNESIANERKVAIYGKRLSEMVEAGIDAEIIDFNKEDLLSLYDLKKNEDNITIIVSGERDRPFSALARICRGQDRYFKLDENDSILMLAGAVAGTEKIVAEVNDAIFKTGADVKVVSKKEIRGCHASREDLLLMLNLLKPKYYIPVKGEYRKLVSGVEVASAVMEEEKIILIDNGEVLHFSDKEMVNKSTVFASDVMVDGFDVGTISDIVLKDREHLKENGILIVSVTLDKKTRKIVAGPVINTRGFVYERENREFINELVELTRTLLADLEFNERINYNEMKMIIRDSLASYIFDEKGRKPMIITMVQSV